MLNLVNFNICGQLYIIKIDHENIIQFLGCVYPKRAYKTNEAHSCRIIFTVVLCHDLRLTKLLVVICFIGDIQVSAYPGRIIVTEPKGFVQPRINVEKHSMRHVVLNGQTTLPCIAQGHPVPTYR